MYNLLKIEILKLKTNRYFKYMFLALCALSVMSMIEKIYTMEVYSRNVTGISTFERSLDGRLSFLIVQSIFMIMFICHDFQNGLFHSEELSGYSRLQILLSKVIICFMANFIFLFCYSIIGTVGMSLIYGVGEQLTSILIMKMMREFLLSFLIICALTAYEILAAFSLKSSTPVATVLIIILLDYTLGGIFIDTMYSKVDMVRFLLDNNILAIFNRLELDMMSGNIMYIILSCAIRIFIILTITYSIFRKRELG